jgi:chromosome segregation ATPase
MKQVTPRLRARSRALTPARRLLEETLSCLRTLTTTWDEQDLEHDLFARRVTKLVHETERFLGKTDHLSNTKDRA